MPDKSDKQIERQPERRRLNPDQRAILLELEEYSHKNGGFSSGLEWIAVPRDLLKSTVQLIGQLRKVD